MSNNLIIINAHIVTPQGRTARKGEAMNGFNILAER